MSLATGLTLIQFPIYAWIIEKVAAAGYLPEQAVSSHKHKLHALSNHSSPLYLGILFGSLLLVSDASLPHRNHLVGGVGGIASNLHHALRCESLPENDELPSRLLR